MLLSVTIHWQKDWNKLPTRLRLELGEISTYISINDTSTTNITMLVVPASHLNIFSLSSEDVTKYYASRISAIYPEA